MEGMSIEAIGPLGMREAETGCLKQKRISTQRFWGAKNYGVS